MFRARFLAVFVALCVVAACSGTDNAPTANSTASPSSSSSASGRGKNKNSNSNDDESAPSNGSGTCPQPEAAPVGKSATTVRLSDDVDAVVYPLADHPGNPWTQWGQGIVHDGKFFSAVGDECGVNGDAYVYEFDPATSTLRLLDDVLSVIPHEAGTFGYGKIHAQMVAGGDGAIYATTYWGSRRGLEYGSGYEGDVLLRIDPATGEIANLGIPVPRHGIPTLAASLDGKLVFGEAPDPIAEENEGVFFVYDLAARKTVFRMDKPTGAPGYRSILVDGSGKAWFSVGDGEVAVYDPTTNTVSPSSERIPGRFLRAASSVARDGTVYGVTQGDTDTLFKVSRDGRVATLGPVRGYTTSIALSPDGSTLYYVPDAHGSAFEQGTPVIAVDTATGDEHEVVKLNDLAEPQLHLRLGGSYDVVIDPTGSSLYVGLNAGDPNSKDTFGAVVLAVVKLH